MALAALALGAPSAHAAAPAWTTYRHDAGRSGIDPDSTNPVTPTQAWQTPALDGQVYGQPLVYGSHVYVATENDSVYELDAATGAVQWANHLATPEPSSAAPCGDISPSIGITSTPVIDPTTNRIYAVGAVSAFGGIYHALFALDLTSGQAVPGFPIVVDPPYPAGGSAVNQLQRPGLALDGGRILIGYGGNNDDCATYWGWMVSAPASGSGGLGVLQVDPGYHAGAIWASGNAPPVDAFGNAFVATGNGIGNSSSNPQYGDSVLKLNASAAPLDWWAPTNWQSLDSSDTDLGSSMPTLLPGGYVFQSGKDGNGYLLNGGALGGVGGTVSQVTGFCAGGSFGGSIYNPANSTLYVACNGGLRAISVGGGSLTLKAGFSAPAGATGPSMIAGGLVWATNPSTGTLYGLNPNSGAVASQFSIPENGSNVNHFASPSAGGGRLFVGSGNQLTAYTVAQAPPPSSTTTTLSASANPVTAGTTVSLTASVAPAPDAGTVTFTDGGAPIPGCSGISVSVATSGQAACKVAFSQPGTHNLVASYSGDAFYSASTSASLTELVTAAGAGVPDLSQLRVSPRRVSVAGRKVGGRCVKPGKRNRIRPQCRRRGEFKVTFKLNEAAFVKLTIKRQVPGRKVKRHCVKATKRNRGHARCWRWAAMPGNTRLTGSAGANGFTIPGKIGGHILGPGTYELTATPISGGGTGMARTASFKVVG